jgi:hypothetical protein
MVKFKVKIYLTDFSKSGFWAKSRKNREFCGGEIFETGAIYHPAIYHYCRLQGPDVQQARQSELARTKRGVWKRGMG